MIDLSIIIVNWNTESLLRNCLTSVYAMTEGISFEVFVVDNASSDSSAEMVEREFPEVRLLRNQANVGFAKANNQAYRLCQGQFVALLNPDTEMLNDAFPLMVHFLKGNPQIGIIGPKLLNPDGTIQTVCARRFPNLYTEFLHMTSLRTYLSPYLPRVFGCWEMEAWDHASNREVDCLSGACLVLRREAIKGAIFDETFFFLGEDIDLCFQIKKDGWGVFYLSEAEVMHIGGASTRQCQNAEPDIEAVISENYFFKKNVGRVHCYLHRWMWFCTSLIKTSFHLLSFPFALFRPSADKRLRIKLYFAIMFWAIGLRRSREIGGEVA